MQRNSLFSSIFSDHFYTDDRTKLVQEHENAHYSLWKYKYESFLLNIRGVPIKRKQYKVLSTKGYLVNLTRLVAHYVGFGLIMLISPFIYPIRADLSL